MDGGKASRLKLIVEKGSLSGQAREFKPGTRVQIGRVKRNTLSINDPGVSSKHLTIQFEFGSNEWTVTDLNSLNGTVLNGVSLTPSVPYTLSEDDVIKIGELTSIEVKISKEEQKKEHNTRSRRNLRPLPVPDNGKNLGVIDENSELGLGFDEELGEKNKEKGWRRRLRPRKNDVKESEDSGRESENLVQNMVRRTRSSTRAENLENGEERGNAVDGKLNVRRTQSSNKAEDFGSDEELPRVVEKVISKRTRGAKKQGKVENGVEHVEAVENVRAVEEKKEQGVSSMRTRSSTKVENMGEIHSMGVEVGDLDLAVGRRTRKGTRARRNLGMEASESVGNGETRGTEMVEKANMGEGCEGDDGNSVKDRTDRTEEEKNVNVGREGDGGLASTSGVKSNSVLLDLEKMTLGEWFDYLEEYLPKQIIEQTDAMILEMRQKAAKVNELLFQQSKGEKGEYLADTW